jgi:hypothetical protein
MPNYLLADLEVTMNRRNDFRKDRGHSKRPSSRRPRPPLRDKLRQFDMIDTSSTGCESQYLSSLIDTCNPIVAVLQQGERIAGQLVWYDQGCLKISPADGSPSLIIPKTSIKYLHDAIFPQIDPLDESQKWETTLGGDRITSE